MKTKDPSYLSEFLSIAIEQILNSPHLQTNILVVKSVIRFINTAAETFVMYTPYLGKVFDFLMWVLA